MHGLVLVSRDERSTGEAREVLSMRERRVSTRTKPGEIPLLKCMVAGMYRDEVGFSLPDFWELVVYW